MYFVDRATARPNRCQALPQLGQDHPKGYVDFGPSGGHPQDPQVYLSVEALQIAARKLPQIGLVPTEDYDVLRSQLEQADAELDDLRAQLQQANQENAAIDLLARKDGQFVKQRRTGRPPKKEQVTNG